MFLFVRFISMKFVHFLILISINFYLIGAFSQMVSDRQKKESAPPVVMSINGSEKTTYFLAEVCCIYLSLVIIIIIIALSSYNVNQVLRTLTCVIYFFMNWSLVHGASLLSGSASFQCWIRKGTGLFKGWLRCRAKGVFSSHHDHPVIFFLWIYSNRPRVWN